MIPDRFQVTLSKPYASYCPPDMEPVDSLLLESFPVVSYFLSATLIVLWNVAVSGVAHPPPGSG